MKTDLKSDRVLESLKAAYATVASGDAKFVVSAYLKDGIEVIVRKIGEGDK